MVPTNVSERQFKKKKKTSITRTLGMFAFGAVYLLKRVRSLPVSVFPHA